MMGDEDEQLYLLASRCGLRLRRQTRATCRPRTAAGKGALTLPKGSQVVQPAPVGDRDEGRLGGSAVSNEGRLLVFPLADLPQMARGKGNKIIGIPPARVQAREEFVVAVQVLTENDTLVVHAGKRHHKLKFSDLEHYRGERGRRGNKLPRGFQKVDAMVVET